MHDRTVADAMHPGVVTTDPTADVESLAATMASHRIHCVVVDGEEWGIVTDMDLLAALHAGEDADAGRLAATEVVAVARQLPLTDAIALMIEHDLSHVVVVDEVDGRPVGVLSSLDVARVAAERSTVLGG